MNDLGVKAAIGGIGAGLLFFFASALVAEVSAIGGFTLFAAFIVCYVVLPIAGLIYDLKSGDFERREGYKP